MLGDKMFESKEDGLKRLSELRLKILFAPSEEEARRIAERFEPVLSLDDKKYRTKVLALNRAIMKHLPPKVIAEEIAKILEEE